MLTNVIEIEETQNQKQKQKTKFNLPKRVVTYIED